LIECTCQDDIFGRTAGEAWMVADMAAKEFIASVTRVLVARARPERVYLIGSFARGQEDCDSDIDLLVVKDTTLAYEASERGSSSSPMSRQLSSASIVSSARKCPVRDVGRNTCGRMHDVRHS